MSMTTPERRYRPTESKYKGRAKEMYVTYDLEQKTRGNATAIYPKVKRVYIAGEVKDWKVGVFAKKSGRRVYGVKVEYEQTRTGYHRKDFTGTRKSTTYEVQPTKVKPALQAFSMIVEIPEAARNIRFHAGDLPEHYRTALQRIA